SKDKNPSGNSSGSQSNQPVYKIKKDSDSVLKPTTRFPRRQKGKTVVKRAEDNKMQITTSGGKARTRRTEKGKPVISTQAPTKKEPVTNQVKQVDEKDSAAIKPKNPAIAIDNKNNKIPAADSIAKARPDSSVKKDSSQIAKPSEPKKKTSKSNTFSF